MDPVVNYVAVVVGAITAFLIGMVWYSPMLFGNTWMKLSGMNDKKIKAGKHKVMMSMAGGLATALLTSFVLAHFVDYAGATTVLGGAMAGFWAWLGFVVTTQVGGVLWEGKPFKLFLLNAAQSLVALAVIGVINAVWV